MIESALSIDGWMEINDLEWLAEQAKTHTAICEVGSWQGRSARVLADNTPGTLWCVDTWASDTVAADIRCVEGEFAFQKFQENLKDHLHSGKVSVLRQPSVDAAYTMSRAGMSFDMIFIDADHELSSIRADILAWKPLVRSGGLFCGHDSGYGPIMQALRELLPNYKNEESMWMVRMP